MRRTPGLRHLLPMSDTMSMLELRQVPAPAPEPLLGQDR
jgi:hypothetical protein